MDRLMERVEGLGSPRVAIVGDFILDRYVYGDVERINPEAPVPVLRVLRRTGSVGGAGNVAAAAAALGARPCCVGVVGRDAGGEELSRMLLAAGADVSGLVRLADRPTAVKTRYVGLAQHRHAQQMLRVDEETVEPLPEDVGKTLRAAARSHSAGCDVFVLEDYNKGVLSDSSAPRIIADARQAGKAVVVDPACIPDYRRYRGATVLKPNRYEASLASKVRIVDDASLETAARQILLVTEAQAVIITLDREGAYLCPADAPGKRIPHRRPRSVYDVTGAGDETVAVLAVALASGGPIEQAVELANVAGGIEVERFGFVPVRRQELLAEIRSMSGLRDHKVLERAPLVEEVRQRRRRGERIVFTNGCFDLLHPGHVKYLQQARQLGDCLIVAVNSDESVKRLKGPGRPVLAQAQRAEMLAAMECVDYVTVFDEDTPIPLLDLLRPEVLAKGGTTPVVVGRELVEDYGGQVVTLEEFEGMSTTGIINDIVARKGG